MTFAFQQDAQRFQHIGLVIRDQNSAHRVTLNRVSDAVSIAAHIEVRTRQERSHEGCALKLLLRRIAKNYGSVCPVLAFTIPISLALIVPLTTTSDRKFVASTGRLACDFTCPTSVALTLLLPLISPASTFMITLLSGIACAAVLVTPLNFTVSCCTSLTPVRFTVMVLPEIVEFATVPVPAVTVAFPVATALLNVKTIE